MSDYTEGQAEAVLRELGVEVITDTDTNVLALCPFHKNNDTPSFSMEKSSGAYLCFNPSCDARGNLIQLVQEIKKCNPFVARRLISKHKGATPELGTYIDDLFAKKDELPTFSVDIINRLADEFWGSPGQAYMSSRGFSDETMAYFQVGYSAVKDMVTIPVHDWDGNPVGMVGRSVEGKIFKNTKKLPTRKVLFNTHRAKRFDKVIIVESSMDAMRVHQAGFPYVVATNGSIFSPPHVQTISRYWNEIIIMTDFDDIDEHRDINCKKCENTCRGHNPGRALGEKMVKALPGKRVRWACHSYGIIYPHGAKDAGDMTLEEIRHCIENSVSTPEYEWMKRDVEILNIL